MKRAYTLALVCLLSFGLSTTSVQKLSATSVTEWINWFFGKSEESAEDREKTEIDKQIEAELEKIHAREKVFHNITPEADGVEYDLGRLTKRSKIVEEIETRQGKNREEIDNLPTLVLAHLREINHAAESENRAMGPRGEIVLEPSTPPVRSQEPETQAPEREDLDTEHVDTNNQDVGQAAQEEREASDLTLEQIIAKSADEATPADINRLVTLVLPHVDRGSLSGETSRLVAKFTRAENPRPWPGLILFTPEQMERKLGNLMRNTTLEENQAGNTQLFNHTPLETITFIIRDQSGTEIGRSDFTGSSLYTALKEILDRTVTTESGTSVNPYYAFYARVMTERINRVRESRGAEPLSLPVAPDAQEGSTQAGSGNSSLTNSPSQSTGTPLKTWGKRAVIAGVPTSILIWNLVSAIEKLKREQKEALESKDALSGLEQEFAGKMTAGSVITQFFKEIGRTYGFKSGIFKALVHYTATALFFYTARSEINRGGRALLRAPFTLTDNADLIDPYISSV